MFKVFVQGIRLYRVQPLPLYVSLSVPVSLSLASVSLVCLSKNPSGLWVAFIECYGLLNTLHQFTQIKPITWIFSYIF